jgi:Tfp pilus assembly protein PilO
MAIVSKLYLLIILWTGYQVYAKFEEHQTNLESLNTQIPTIEGTIARAKKEKKQLENYFSDIEEAKQRIQKVRDDVEKVQRQFPSEISDTENISLLSSIAESLNIKNISLSPSNEESKGFYFTKAYTIKADGTFLQFLIFLERISEAPRLMNVRDIKLVQKNNKQKGRFQVISSELVVEVYRYNQSHKEDTGIEEIEQKFKSGMQEKKPRKKRVKNEET